MDRIDAYRPGRVLRRAVATAADSHTRAAVRARNRRRLRCRLCRRVAEARTASPLRGALHRGSAAKLSQRILCFVELSWLFCRKLVCRRRSEFSKPRSVRDGKHDGIRLWYELCEYQGCGDRPLRSSPIASTPPTPPTARDGVFPWYRSMSSSATVRPSYCIAWMPRTTWICVAAFNRFYMRRTCPACASSTSRPATAS